MFEMLPGYHTQNLVSEIFRLTDGNSKVSVDANNFSWLEKYQQAKAGESVDYLAIIHCFVNLILPQQYQLCHKIRSL